MKAFIVACVLGSALTGSYVCAEEGDHIVRPRPEYDDLQQEILLARRVQLYGTDMKGIPAGGITTDFGKRGFVNLTESAEPELVFAP